MADNANLISLLNTRNNLMRTPIARLVNCVALASLCVAVASTPLRAEPDTNSTKQRISRSLASLARVIDEIKWANVTIYRLRDELKQRMIEPQRNASALDSGTIEAYRETITFEPLVNPPFYNTVIRIATPARIRRDPAAFRERLAAEYGLQPDDLDEQQTNEVLGIASKVLTELANIPKDYLLITTRDRNNPLLIALVGIEDLPAGGFSLKGQPQGGLDLYNFLRPLDSGLYTDLRSAVSEGSESLTNQMFVLRDLSEISLAPPTRAQATYISEDRFPYVLTSISEGRPLRQQDSARLFNANLFTDPTVPGFSAAPGTVEYPYEISVGTDVLASFMAYRMTNDTLPVPEPEWGVELRNNFDEINYPSIWGGRLTLNAILENIRLGAVLPQIRFGGNTVDSSGIGSRQQKIIGGYGLALSGDFAAPLLNNSGLFDFYGSYTFSEANTEGIRLFEGTGAPELGYLIRYAFQAYYSFGFFADADAKHLFRLKFGGTVYGVEGYSREVDPEFVPGQEGEEAPTLLVKQWNRSRGGVSGRIEYMKGGQMVPWGAGVQYFDQSILANVWLQFAINNRLDLKLEGKYFTSFDGDERLITHPWENQNLIVPSLSVKYHFGPAPAAMP